MGREESAKHRGYLNLFRYLPLGRLGEELFLALVCDDTTVRLSEVYCTVCQSDNGYNRVTSLRARSCFEMLGEGGHTSA